MSSFNLQNQEKSIDSKIVVALERISEAFRVLLWNESKDSSLSPIQIQILIFILFHSREKCRVSYLAEEFNMTKATISDSVKILLKKNLVKKEEDISDTRSYCIRLTQEGINTATKASSFAQALERPLDKISSEQKEALLNSLLKIIRELHQSGIITIQRMCFTCANYKYYDHQHYCTLLQSGLSDNELRVDCPEHEMAL